MECLTGVPERSVKRYLVYLERSPLLGRIHEHNEKFGPQYRSVSSDTVNLQTIDGATYRGELEADAFPYATMSSIGL